MGICRSLCHSFSFENMRFVKFIFFPIYKKIYLHRKFISEFYFFFYSHTCSFGWINSFLQKPFSDMLFFDCTYFDMGKFWKITFSAITFLVWIFLRQDSAISYIFLLDIQCTTCCIENTSVKRANSHFTIFSLLTLTHIIF